MAKAGPTPRPTTCAARSVQHCDQAGVVTSETYDFKGNLLASRRQLATEYKSDPRLVDRCQHCEPQVFTSSTTYRRAQPADREPTAPDGSVYRPTFNEANLLEKVDVICAARPTATPFVTDIDYDAKGQRTLIDYGNGVRTTYAYDPLTFRLTRLTTTRPTGLNGLATQLFKNAGMCRIWATPTIRSAISPTSTTTPSRPCTSITRW